MSRATLLAAILCALTSAARAGDITFFEARIRPVLAERCYACHSATAGKAKGGLVVDTRDGLRKGGGSGPAIVPGDPGASLILDAIRHDDDSLKMPPRAADRLSREQVADFERWIRDGADDPRIVATSAATDATDSVRASKTYWAFQPVADPAVPSVLDTSWPRNEVDRFLLAAIESKGLSPAPEADKRTLIRRITFDLTGLPPTPEEVDGFLADCSPGAYESLVDRLLASPRYGERWGRHWLDLVRYADTSGCNSDYPVPQAARYRDYVVSAFNRDMPYDRFLREQVAGDLLTARSEAERKDAIVATGYLAIARRFGSHNADKYLTIEDVIDNLGKVTLGLSVSCARCHDHKFDPIPQGDYYALYGIFDSTKLAFPGTEIYQHTKDFVALGTPEEARTLHAYEAEFDALDAKAQKLANELKPAAAAEKEAAKGGTPKPGLRSSREIKAEIAATKAAQRKHEKDQPKLEKAYGASEGTPADARVQKKGDPKAPGETVRRGFLTVLGGQTLPPDAKGSGRIELARWLTDPKNPLTARVMVNRVWQGHFGRGIVATPSDFGVRGDRPSHPELLDWLTSRFIADGWSIKALHRRIVLSHAYAMASEGTSVAATVDPNNALLTHFSRRRLSAEEIRDAMLSASGKLDLSAPGPHPFPPEMSWKYTQHKPFVAVYESDHRSIYLMQQRFKKHPFLETFDGADTNATTAVRPLSATALQALFFLNDPLAHAQADALAGRLMEGSKDQDAQVHRAHRLLFGRAASAEDLAIARTYRAEAVGKLDGTEVAADRRERAALASYARVLMSTNEFLHVD